MSAIRPTPRDSTRTDAAKQKAVTRRAARIARETHRRNRAERLTPKAR